MNRTMKRHLKKIALFGSLLFVVHGIYAIFWYTRDIEIAHMVCLTYNQASPQPSSSEGTWYAGEKEYHLLTRWCDQIRKHITIYTESPPLIPYRNLGGFLVHYRPLSELPSTHKVIANQTAYFLGNLYDFEPENFFHFTRQVYFPLYWLIKSTNRLYEGAQNILFYPRIYAVCHSGKYWYHDADRYRYFNQILHVKNKLEITAHIDNPLPHNVCYKNAVFSSELFLDKASHAIEYFKQTLGVHDRCESNILVILNRRLNRRIVNIDALKKIGDSLGYDTRVIYMEKLTLKEQAQLIHCTKVLAGITGAGLQWAFFMKNHSGVVEMAFPHQDWPFFFTGSRSYNSLEKDTIRPLNFVQLSKAECRLNPPALNQYWEELFYVNGTFTEEESLAITADKRNYHFWSNVITSLGKICDVFVDPDAFRAAVISAGK